MLGYLPAVGAVASAILVSFYPLGDNTMREVAEGLESRRRTK